MNWQFFIDARVGYLLQKKDTITSTIDFWSFGHIRTKDDFSSRTFSAYPRKFFCRTKAKTWTKPDFFLLISHSYGISPSSWEYLALSFEKKKETPTPMFGLHKKKIYSLLQQMPSPRDISSNYLLQTKDTPILIFGLRKYQIFSLLQQMYQFQSLVLSRAMGDPFLLFRINLVVIALSS